MLDFVSDRHSDSDFPCFGGPASPIEVLLERQAYALENIMLRLDALIDCRHRPIDPTELQFELATRRLLEEDV